MLLDSTGFDQAKSIIGHKHDNELEKICYYQVINADCLDFNRVVAHGSAVRLTTSKELFYVC